MFQAPPVVSLSSLRTTNPSGLAEGHWDRGIPVSQSSVTTAVAATPSWNVVNYDPVFNSPAQQGQSITAYRYWHPNVHNVCGATGNIAYISNNTLHTRQNDTVSRGWECFDNAVGQEGNFPWQIDCSHISGQPPDWSCPRNTYGLSVLADLAFNTTLSLNALLLKRSGFGDYNIIVDLYFFLTDGPEVIQGQAYHYLEAEVRLAYDVQGADLPVGTETTWTHGFDFGYSKTIDQLTPGHNETLTEFDLRGIYRTALVKWGFSPDTRAVLAGVEVGTEGFGIALSVDWAGLRILTYEPDVVRADVDQDHFVDRSDLSLVQSLVGACPGSQAYQWRADANSTNPCIDSADLSLVEHYLGSSVPPFSSKPSGVFSLPVGLLYAFGGLAFVVVVAALVVFLARRRIPA